MNSRQSRTTHQMAAHNHYLNNSFSKSANIVVLKGDSLNSEKYRPKLPSSLRFSKYDVEQIPYIEGLGWMLIYLFRRYPEIKDTQGFEYAHVRGVEHTLRKGFYETHAFFTIDVGVKGMAGVSQEGEGITIDVVYGKLEGEQSCWTVEVFSEGGLVRKFVCDTQEQVIFKLTQQFHKYGLIRMAWNQCRTSFT